MTPNFDNDEPLNALLSYLNERGTETYEELHRMITMLCEARGCNPDAEELADKTLDIVARRIQKGLQIVPLTPFIYGVARNVIRDYWDSRKRKKTESLIEDVAVEPNNTRDREQWDDCLERCLKELSPDCQYLIREFYRENKQAKSDHRKALARQLGITVNALVIRAFKIRRNLEPCVRRCVDGTI